MHKHLPRKHYPATAVNRLYRYADAPAATLQSGGRLSGKRRKAGKKFNRPYLTPIGKACVDAIEGYFGCKATSILASRGGLTIRFETSREVGSKERVAIGSDLLRDAGANEVEVEHRETSRVEYRCYESGGIPESEEKYLARIGKRFPGARVEERSGIRCVETVSLAYRIA
jgi:hypothetical protein